MAKIKLKKSTVIKKHDGEAYIFKNGVAKVPGTSMSITLKEFNTLIMEVA